MTPSNPSQRAAAAPALHTPPLLPRVAVMFSYILLVTMSALPLLPPVVMCMTTMMISSSSANPTTAYPTTAFFHHLPFPFPLPFDWVAGRFFALV